ncbi:MAG: cupin domain-containing protein [Planctomycetes bacterium]|nr:cupin domain-containing protein [Planctomycetota bacterium]
MSAKSAFTVELNARKEYQRLLDDKTQTHGMKAGRVYLEPNHDCHEHSTEAREEMLVFLSGQGQVLLRDQNPMAVGVGKVAYIPPHTLHNVQNTGEEPLEYIFCVVPADMSRSAT